MSDQNSPQVDKHQKVSRIKCAYANIKPFWLGIWLLIRYTYMWYKKYKQGFCGQVTCENIQSKQGSLYYLWFFRQSSICGFQIVAITHTHSHNFQLSGLILERQTSLNRDYSRHLTKISVCSILIYCQSQLMTIIIWLYDDPRIIIITWKLVFSPSNPACWPSFYSALSSQVRALSNPLNWIILGFGNTY